jgi:uncharacterized membrane protein (DUF2068 family)
MRPRLENYNNVPRGVILISKAFLWIGSITLGVSILILLLGFVFLLDLEEVNSIERPGLLWILSLMLGVPGILLGLMSTISSFGLRKMQKWGLWCSYLTMMMWVLLYTVFPGIKLSITTPFGLLINLISLTILFVEIYLTRTYYRYFTQR